MEDNFNRLGVGAVVGTRLMELLGLSKDDLADGKRWNQFKDTIEFFSRFPEDDQRFMVSKVAKGKIVDKLQHMWEYSQLFSRKLEVEKQLDPPEGEPKPTPAVQLELKHILGTLKSEIALYESAR
jgi:hypothetical protein